MANKNNLATRLIERSESIIYRKIKSELIKCAQNNKQQFIILYGNIDQYSITKLQNEGIKVTEINEFGFDKYLLEW